MHSQQQWENFCKLQEERRTKEQQEHFYKWVKTDDNEFKLHMFLDQIYTTIDNSPYELINKKEFKDEFATFIYKLTYNAQKKSKFARKYN
jgi:hypothetical protein